MKSVKTRQVVLLLALMAILLAIPPWRSFQSHPHWDRITWVPFTPPLRLRDLVINVLLFMPVGAGVALNVRRGAVVKAAAVTLVLSAAGEFAQVYSHGRFPSATDLCTNVLGGAAAAWGVSRYGSRSVRL